MFYKLNPQFCGVFGRKTLYAGELTDIPAVIYRMHAEFNVFPDDELIEVSRQFMVTPQLAEQLKGMQPRATGIFVEEVTATTTLEFRRAYPGKELPELKWLKITGKGGKDDFGLSSDFQLIVSERAMLQMRPKISSCKIVAYVPEQV